MSKMFGWIVGGIAVLGVFLSISALVGGNQSAGEPVTPVVNVSMPNIGEIFGAAGDIVTNVINFTKGAKLGDRTQLFVAKTLEAGSNQTVLFRNQTGRDMWIGYGDVTIETGDTASSTSKVYILSTTTSSIGTWADFGTIAMHKGALINGDLFATSTTASTTSSIRSAINGRGNGTVLVPDGNYVIGYFQQNVDTVTGCRGAVGLCESATSTRRGADPIFTVRLHY